MNTISFPREGVDGKKRDKAEIEEWYLSQPFVEEIYDRLVGYKAPKKVESLHKSILADLKRILLLSPKDLNLYTQDIDRHYSRHSDPDTANYFFNLKTFFQYADYRKTVLIDLARMLNVKTCPYCNMSYTLYADEIVAKGKPLGLARFQFDHFYSKSDYPMLSMSLYNLVPSCPLCNQSKSKKKMSLAFHPYNSDIQASYHFKLNKLIRPLTGAMMNDEIDLELVRDPSIPKSDFEVFENTYHLKAIYSRHGDIAQEVFDKANMIPYYRDPGFFPFLSKKDPKYRLRLLLGVYPDKKDISRRPMSKFVLDLLEQALIGDGESVV